MSKKCVGCGITLQQDDVNKDGFVSSSDFSLCERCFRIKHYNENRKVVNRNSLSLFELINKDDIVIYVSSLLTLNLDYIDKFNNVILVLTKRDIIPKSVNNNKIISYVKNRYNLLDILIVSANRNYNLDVLYNKLCKYSKKKIYFVGESNSGKSTLINKLTSLYGNNNSMITTSAFPNTTMDIIEIKLNDLNVFDTPGIVNDKSIINYLDNSALKKINSKKEIKPITFQIKGNGSIIVDVLFRIDYKTTESSLTFYLSNFLNVKSISVNNPSFAGAKFDSYDNLSNSDLVISDIGYIKITKNVNIKISYNDMIDVRIRDNLI